MTFKGKVLAGIGALAALLIVGGAVGYSIFRDKLTVAVPDYPPVRRAVWLDQGWTAEQREPFHHRDQGTQTFNIPYEWFVALEQPRLSLFGDVGRLSDPAYLDRYGFIPGATRGGENQLGIGFARGKQMREPNGKIWINPQTKEEMFGIGFTCAACHTGRFTYRKTTVLIDGGPALVDLGKFRQALGISVLFTRLVPGRFDGFARNVLGEEASDEAKATLRQQLDNVWERFNQIRKLDKQVADRSIEEGFGRLDALNRIGNQIFSVDLRQPENYAPTTAPVSFPHIWNAAWFDWVQYNGSIEQPMVRNAGEALGVSAYLNLSGPQPVLFEFGVQVDELFEIEKQLAGATPSEEHGFTGLRSPRWPEQLLGLIDTKRAARGAELYEELCRGCHLAPVGSVEFWRSKNWLPPNEYGKSVLHVNLIPIAMVGTDPAQAADMIARKVTTPPELGLETDSFGFALGRLVEKTVTRWYDTQTPPVPEDRQAEMNGFSKNGIQAPMKYKARPLNGIWATAPFLHNGSVPNIYALLSPVEQRPKVFYVGRREFDPVCLGYQLVAIPPPESQLDLRCLGNKTKPESGEFFGAFKFETQARGNHNTGHEFKGDGKGDGIVGRALSPEERLALIEFLKQQ